MRSAPSLIERMNVYQLGTGLKPVGHHRATADRLLHSLSNRCPRCAGRGYRAVGSGWLWCGGCCGLGRVITPKARIAFRRWVLGRYPEAAVESAG